MLDYTEDLEQRLTDIQKFQINGYHLIKTIAQGSFWDVSLIEKDGHSLIIKQFNQNNIHNYSREEIKDIIYDAIQEFQNAIKTNIFYGFLGISFRDLNDRPIDIPIIIQKYAKNKSLNDLLLQSRKNPRLLDDTKKMSLIYGLAQNMKNLIENRLIYRNLKPSKILLDENYNPFLSASGSKMMEIDKNIFDDAYLYAAPETLSNKYSRLNEKTNVFSFGMIMYQILTGKKPYEDEDISNINLHEIQLHAKRENEFKIPENVPSYLKYMLSLMLNNNQEERPPFNLIVDYFDYGIILPTILRNKKETIKYSQITRSFHNQEFRVNSINDLKELLNNSNINEKYKAVIHFFLADYYNDLYSQRIIGKYYYYGTFFPMNGKKALEYFQKAEKQKDAESIFFIGQIYQNGINCKAEKGTAWKYFNKSASLNYKPAQDFIKNICDFLKADFRNAPVALVTGKIFTGKTTFINALINQYNKKDELPTICAQDYKVVHVENDNSYCFMIRDSMDMDRFAQMLPLCCRDVSVCIVMYSINDRTSFDSIDSYITELKNKCDDPKFIIIGNKIDLSNAVVTEEEGEQKAREYNAEFREVSAARGTNISDTRSLIARITHESQQGGNHKKHIDDIKIIEAYEKPSSCC